MVYFAALSHCGRPRLGSGPPGAQAGTAEPSLITALGPSGPTVFWKRCVSFAARIIQKIKYLHIVLLVNWLGIVINWSKKRIFFFSFR